MSCDSYLLDCQRCSFRGHDLLQSSGKLTVKIDRDQNNQRKCSPIVAKLHHRDQSYSSTICAIATMIAVPVLGARPFKRSNCWRCVLLTTKQCFQCRTAYIHIPQPNSKLVIAKPANINDTLVAFCGSSSYGSTWQEMKRLRIPDILKSAWLHQKYLSRVRGKMTDRYIKRRRDQVTHASRNRPRKVVGPRTIEKVFQGYDKSEEPSGSGMLPYTE